MKTKLYKWCFYALAIAVMFAFNSCSQDELNIPQNEEISITSLNKTFSKKKVSFASGQAGLIVNGRFANFAFHAIEDVDGNVSGSYEAHSPGVELRTHGTIDCLIFVDDNTAVMAGYMTQVASGSVFGDIPVGTEIWFKVRDNGEGKAFIDQFSDYWGFGFYYCGDWPDAPMDNIVNGNIQVKRYSPKN
jgi:hypothetical protein